MIDFSRDPKVTDALQQWRGRAPWPTEFGSADLRGFSREVRQRAVFSARTTNADYLGEVAEVVDDILANKINMAQGRVRLMHKLKVLGYDPAKGFPKDMANVPPAERGSLQDLGSYQRLKLVLETNVRKAMNYGRLLAGMAPYMRREYPAWELKRLYNRDVPRGTPDSHSVGWQRRWRDAAESVQWEGVWQPKSEGTTRMIALKASAIWKALGEGAGGHDGDALGDPFPPFAFNSGMGWVAVGRSAWDSLEDARDEGDSSFIIHPSSLSEAPSFAPAPSALAKAMAALPPDLQAQLDRELEGIV